MANRILFGGRRTGKTKALLHILDNENVEFHFSIDDFEHEREIRQQIFAMTGRNCKISWWIGFEGFLKYKARCKK